ncbi:cytokine receptor isoform X2 [Periplaneta americana]|uniref:cytokine receptor isoform X2 n=1 Tax=Periplaneta americana TaxID=6978 RepID=UPI0037E70C3E
MQTCWSSFLNWQPGAQSKSSLVHCIGWALLLNLLLIFHGSCGNENTCGIGLITPGVTIPKGDINLEYGNPLKILCVLNSNHSTAAGKNSSDIVFFHDNRKVPEEFVRVVNSTALEIFIEQPPVSSSMYYCKLKTKEEPAEDAYTAICLNRVVVDRKPQEVQNFSCISRNWQNLTCSWKKPPSHVKTKYDLAFRLPGRAGGRMHYKCPKVAENDTDGSCFWDLSTNPHYRLPYEYYYFTLTGRNIFGNWSKQFKFHHYSHVIPAPAAELTIVNTTYNYAVLKWSVPFPMQLFPPGVVQKVEYQSMWDKKDEWKSADTTMLLLHNEYYVYTLKNLSYANTLYDVRVYMRSPLAVGEDKWSAPTRNTFKTKPTVPGAVPKTDIGSFEVSGGLPNRDVYIYWQHIPEHLKNGDNFEYKIISVEENGRQLQLTPNETTNAYAKFRGISFNSFRFKIVAANKEGYSQNVSEVYVPSKTELPPEPISFTKIAFEKGEYELSWKEPVSDKHEIVNYTIFWCNHERDRPYQCTGFLNWTHVSRSENVKKINVPEDKIYQFAISANTRNASSGMVWASCTVIHNKVVGKMKSVWINRIGSTFIEVGWKLDCSDRIGTVQGFNIYYCPIVSPYNLTCKEDGLNTTVMGDPQTIHGNITNLKPYTTYMVAIAVITQTGEGLQSEPLYNTTLEAAPVAPGPVKITEVTNTSMVVTWQPPKFLNGALRNYDVFYGTKSKRLNVNTNEKPETIPVSMKLENLTSYHVYNVSVVACTTACSEKSLPVTVQTDIGVPGEMERPLVHIINSSMVSVKWKPPTNPGGLLNYYEVTAIKVDGDSERNETSVFNTTATQIEIPLLDCEAEGYLKYLFQVRAVNIGNNNMTYYGNWSNPGESTCYSSVIPHGVIIVIWLCGVIVFIALIVLFCYVGKRAWLRCKEMRDVEVKLPPGLDPSEKEKDPPEFWPSVETRDHIPGKPRSNAPADEERLLQKKEERHGRNPSGDSSGCSSGHESVSSSLTSGTQFSSDSGTEVDQHPPSPDGVFPDSPTWESSSLRQRNVGSLRPEGSSDGSRWDPYVKMGKGGGSGGSGSVARSTPNLTDLEGLGVGVGPGGPGTGYTCLGTWSSTGYISMPSSEEMGSSGGMGVGTGSGIGLGSGVATTGGYCRVGLDGRPTEGQSPQQHQQQQQQQQQQQVQPHKGYVSLASMIDTSPSTSTANSSVHSSPRQPPQQSRGYVTHHPLWPASKETSAGKGYVMAGEVANKVPATSSSLLTSEVEEENQGILDADVNSGGEDNHDEDELHSPESYCRFGLHPSMIPMSLNTGIMEPEQQERTTSGYVTLSDESRLPVSGMSSGGGGQDSRRAGVSGAANGYVPHRQFEKRDALALSQTAYQDHTEEPYTKVFPPNIGDAKVKSPSTSV